MHARTRHTRMRMHMTRDGTTVRRLNYSEQNRFDKTVWFPRYNRTISHVKMMLYMSASNSYISECIFIQQMPWLHCIML